MTRTAVAALVAVLLLAACSDGGDGDVAGGPAVVRGDEVAAPACPVGADVTLPRPQAPPLPGPVDAYLVCLAELDGAGEPVRMSRGTAPYAALDDAAALRDEGQDEGAVCRAIGYIGRPVLALVAGRAFEVRPPVDRCGLPLRPFTDAIAAAIDLLPVTARATVGLDRPESTAVLRVGEVLEVTAEGGEAVSPADPRMRVIREGPLTPPSVSLFYALEPGVAVLTARDTQDAETPAVRVLRVRVRP